MSDISIVTDSTSDIPEDLLQKYAVSVVRNLIIINGESLVDGVDISRSEYYDRLPKFNPPPTTATASVGVYQQTYENLLAKGARYILSMHPPSRLSGIINAASVAAETFSHRVQVWDSGQVSLGLGFQVIAAAEAIQQGANLDQTLRKLEKIRPRVYIIAMLDTLEYIRRSGRVSWARARLGNLLQIKPFIQLREGIVASLGESRTRQKGLQRLRQFLHKLGTLDHLAILHTNAEADAIEFGDSIKPVVDLHPLIVNITTVIGTHVGPNGLGFAAVMR